MLLSILLSLVAQGYSWLEGALSSPSDTTVISAVKWVVIRMPPPGRVMSPTSCSFILWDDGYFTRGIVVSLILWYTLLASQRFGFMYSGGDGHEVDLTLEPEDLSFWLILNINDVIKWLIFFLWAKALGMEGAQNARNWHVISARVHWYMPLIVCVLSSDPRKVKVAITRRIDDPKALL